MAISDIPEFVTAQPGDLISAGNWNSVQQQMRNSLRTHHHTRASGTPPNDSGTSDDAEQIGTNDIAPGAVTASQLASGAVTAAGMADGAVTTTKIADLAVTSAKIANAAVTSAKLSFQTIQQGSLTLPPAGSSEQVVQTGAPTTKTTVYFPTLAIVSSSGAGISDVTAQIIYRQAVGSTSIDVYVRLTNSGAATANIIWLVLTFASS